MSEDKKGLDNTTITLMICTALFFDALQWLLGWIFMGWLASIFAGFDFLCLVQDKGNEFYETKEIGCFWRKFHC